MDAVNPSRKPPISRTLRIHPPSPPPCRTLVNLSAPAHLSKTNLPNRLIKYYGCTQSIQATAYIYSCRHPRNSPVVSSSTARTPPRLSAGAVVFGGSCLYGQALFVQPAALLFWKRQGMSEFAVGCVVMGCSVLAGLVLTMASRKVSAVEAFREGCC
jgi:hypothetical protein